MSAPTTTEPISLHERVAYNGEGVVAKREFAPSEWVARFEGEMVRDIETCEGCLIKTVKALRAGGARAKPRLLDDLYRHLIVHSQDTVFVDVGHGWTALRITNELRDLRQSDDPNLHWEGVDLFAIRRIKAGDELFIDWCEGESEQ